MQGTHLLAQWQGLGADAPVRDSAALRQACLQAVAASGLQAVGENFHRFAEPGGVTGVVLLAESHLAVHTWPELDAVTVDVYVCNLSRDNSAQAHTVLEQLRLHFQPRQQTLHTVQRALPLL